MTDRDSKTPMTFGQGVFIIILLCAGLGLPFVSTFILKPVPQWEYTIKSIPDASFTGSINDYGKEGWELVFARRASDHSDEYNPKFSYEVIFKRQKSL